jgi:hypothetical protein
MLSRLNREVGLPETPKELTVPGLFVLADYVLNNCGVIYRDKSNCRSFGWHEADAPAWLTVTADIDLPPKPLHRPIAGGTLYSAPYGLHTQKVVLTAEEEGTAFVVDIIKDASYLERLDFEQDDFPIDAWRIFRMYCTERFRPIHPKHRRMVKGKLNDLIDTTISLDDMEDKEV